MCLGQAGAAGTICCTLFDCAMPTYFPLGFTKMKKPHLIVSVAALSLLVVATLSAGAAVVENKGWLYGSEADEAIELAQKHNVPIAIMRMFRETDCPKCIGASRQMAASKSTKQMVRVMAYVGEGSADLGSAKVDELMRKAHAKSKDKSNWIPDLYFVMPDGTALGFVPYEDAAKTESQASAVLQMAAWIKGVPGVVEKADRDADKNRFDSAIKAIDAILEQDAQISHLIQQQLGQIDNKEPMPATPVIAFFAGLKDEKMTQYKALALQKIAEARKMIEKEEYREAQRLLKTLSRIPEDFEAKAQAETLMLEVVEKLKAAS